MPQKQRLQFCRLIVPHSQLSAYCASSNQTKMKIKSYNSYISCVAISNFSKQFWLCFAIIKNHETWCVRNKHLTEAVLIYQLDVGQRLFSDFPIIYLW